MTAAGAAPRAGPPCTCLKAFQASRPSSAMVIGDIPPEDVRELGVLGPRGPFCMPLRTSSRPMALSFGVRRPLTHAPEMRSIWGSHDGYKATAPQPRWAAAPALLSKAGAFRSKARCLTDRPIAVAGAGAIGCFVGGMLAAGGRRVRFWCARG